MKGTIDLHEKWGWGVINHTDESIPDWIPLHPDDLTHFAEMKERFDNFEARVLSSPEVEFETIIHPKFTGRIIYAKLNTKEEPKQTDENGKPLTYWGGLAEPKQETLEEAVNNFKKTDVYINEIKQAQERRYSEEEVLEILFESSCNNDIDKKEMKEWFEQFKKK